jgi:putative Mg2+ transporter-C (MgtC) family protein
MDMLPAEAQLRILAMVALAAILGALIGLERQRSDKPAGTRTMALVTSACALIVGLGTVLDSVNEFGDPARALQAVITGIGFLGAGTIVQTVDGERRTAGITTAATVFATAGIGVAVGLNAPITAVGATVVMLAILRAGHVVESAAEKFGRGKGTDEDEKTAES